MTIHGDEVSEVENFKYLGFFVQKNGGFDKNVKQRSKYGWIKWS